MGEDLEKWLNPPEKTDEAPKEPPEKLKKYLKMIKMKIPLNVVKNKMKQNGDDIAMLENWLNPPTKTDEAPKEPPEKLKKYLKMMKMKIPLNVVKNKMKQNGDDVQMLENWLNGKSNTTTIKKKEKRKKEDPN